MCLGTKEIEKYLVTFRKRPSFRTYSEVVYSPQFVSESPFTVPVRDASGGPSPRTEVDAETEVWDPKGFPRHQPWGTFRDLRSPTHQTVHGRRTYVDRGSSELCTPSTVCVGLPRSPPKVLKSHE